MNNRFDQSGGGSITEKMIIEAFERAVNEGGGFYPQPMSMDLIRKVDKAIKEGAEVPPTPFDGPMHAILWLSMWERDKKVLKGKKK